MAVVPKIPGLRGAASDVPPERQVPADVRKRIQRSINAVRPYEPVWQECQAFFDGDQYCEVNAVSDTLDRVETREGSQGKPRWRPRLVRNRFAPKIVAEVGQLTGRTPGWECMPDNADPQKKNAARYGEKVLYDLHRRLRCKEIFRDVGMHAATTGAGFAWPFWNPAKGKAVIADPDTGQVYGTGEIEVEVLGQSEVLWDPGRPFGKSRYHIVRQAQPVSEVTQRGGYTGPKQLQPDAMSAPHEARKGEEARDLVFVYHFLERPCPDYVRGRWLQIANGQLIAAAEDFPRQRRDGSIVDEPAVHVLEWYSRPHKHRALGLGEMLRDPQRTINRTVNQIVAWVNLVLNPQLMAPKGAFRTKVNLEEPGRIIEYRLIGGQVPKIRDIQEVPQSLFQTIDQALSDMDEIAGSANLPAGVESAQAISGVNQRELDKRSIVIGNQARFYGSFGMHLLEIVAARYTEPRLLQIESRFGVELVPGFLGSMVADVIGVEVSEASIEPRTRAVQEAKIMSFAERGWIDPHQAMAALNGGTAEQLIDGFELDIARANRNIQTVIAMGRMEPEAMPRAEDFDDHPVHIDCWNQWMKTLDFERQPPLVKEAARLVRQMHMDFMAQEQAQAAQAAAQMAAAQGMGNASKPQGPPQMPSPPSLGTTADAISG